MGSEMCIRDRFWVSANDFSECRQQVVVIADPIDVGTRLKHTRPPPKAWDSSASLIDTVFFAFVLTVVVGSCRAIVGNEYHQRFPLNLPRLKLFDETPKIVINVLDHAVKTDRVSLQSGVGKLLFVGVWSDEWSVWRVGADVRKERLLPFLRAHPCLLYTSDAADE